MTYTAEVDKPKIGVHTVVIDCSSFTYIDSVGLHALPAVSMFKLLSYEQNTSVNKCHNQATRFDSSSDNWSGVTEVLKASRYM